MANANTFVSVVLASLLLSQTKCEDQRSCETVLDNSIVEVRKEGGATCFGLKWQVKCAGLCNSRSTVELKGRAVHWKQDCECCQPIGHQSTKIKVSLNCTDGSTEYMEMPLIIPKRCQCTNC